ncbi:phage holin family protein [Erwinia typographi]|uniref:phage holin family protein n=1 Tax=Erwinia typographi TaxID=371042 RepID=UPI00090778E4|nr:phage holin family protein [Erwinia typographi]
MNTLSFEYCFQLFLLNANAIICAFISVKVFLWRLKHRPNNLMNACITYFVIISCAAIAIRTLTGEYMYADWAETVINFSLFIISLVKSGNLFSSTMRKN